MHPSLVPPDSLKGQPPEEVHRWKTEYGAVSTLRKIGHEVRPLGVQDELNPIRVAAEEWKPDVVFNLLEEFYSLSDFDSHVVSYLELLKLPYTGCNPRGLFLARSKAITKKIAAYHRVRVPAFIVVARGRKPQRPKSLRFPLFVKSASEEASLGISQASLVDTDERLAERVRFVHESVGTDAIVEEYIQGRELYVAAIGNERVRTLPVWELDFGKLAETGEPIATERVKHSLDYQKKHGIDAKRAENLDANLQRALDRTTAPRLPHARAGRLRPRGLPAHRGGRAVPARGEPEPGDRREGGVRERRARGGALVPAVDPAHRVARPGAARAAG